MNCRAIIGHLYALNALTPAPVECDGPARFEKGECGLGRAAMGSGNRLDRNISAKVFNCPNLLACLEPHPGYIRRSVAKSSESSCLREEPLDDNVQEVVLAVPIMATRYII